MSTAPAAAGPAADAGARADADAQSDEEVYAGALVVQRAKVNDDEATIGVVLRPEPARAGYLVVLGMGTGFTNVIIILPLFATPRWRARAACAACASET